MEILSSSTEDAILGPAPTRTEHNTLLDNLDDTESACRWLQRMLRSVHESWAEAVGEARAFGWSPANPEGEPLVDCSCFERFMQLDMDQLRAELGAGVLPSEIPQPRCLQE